jgi:hypothetical protein
MAVRCLAATLIACTLFPHTAQAGGPAPGRGASALPPYGVRVRGGGLNGSYRLPAPDSCPNPSHWSLVAGWLGQPLAAVNYSS